MKKILLTLLLSLGLVACSSSGEEASEKEEATETEETVSKEEEGEKDYKIKLGVSPVPHGEIVEYIQDDLKDQGLDVEIVEFNDYLTPNIALGDGSIDANFFQHQPFLEENAKTNNLDLVSIGNVHLEPLAFYSSDYDSIDDLEEGGEILIPNDPTNCARALKLLDENGLISLKDPDDINATERDIVENPKNFTITALEAAAIPSSYEDAAGAVINSNYALKAGLSPKDDGLIIESKDSPYANLVAVRAGEEDREEFKILIETLQSDKVKEFIEDKYQGEILPAF